MATVKNVLFIFGQLTDEDVEWLTRKGGVEEVASGTALIREGQPIDSVYVVLTGSFAVSREGGARPVARVGPGEMLGEMSFIEASLPSADITASTDSAVLRIPRPELARRLVSDHPFAARFYRAVAMMLSDRLRETSAGFSGPVKEGVLERDELDPNVLESLTRAGERFERMLKSALG
jgi:CRP/FNR family cyclic AMP-dependent transcriptional regulator